MGGAWNVPVAGALLGLTVLLLVDPLFPGSTWWVPPILAIAVAALSALLISYGVNHLPAASPPSVARLTTAMMLAATAGEVLPLLPRTDSILQTIVMVAAPFLMFRAVVLTVDLFTPSFTVSLLAGLSGMAVLAAAVPLLALSHPTWSLWACLGIAAAVGYLEGLVVGRLLKPSFPA